MKQLMKTAITVILLAFFTLAFPGSVYAQNPDGDKVVLGESYRLQSGETLNGNLVVFGGSVSLDSGSRVNGDVAVAGGNVDVRGEVTGNILAMGGSVNLSSSAVVSGSVNVFGGSLKRDSGAVVRGGVISGSPDALRLPFAMPDFTPRPQPSTPRIHVNFQPLVNFIWLIFQALALAALAVLVVLFLPKPTQNVACSIVAQPLLSGGIGLLTVVVAPALLVLLAITILLIPLSLVGVFVLVIAGLFGWIALGMEVGNRLASMFKTEWAPPVSAGLGTLLLALVTCFIGLIPCVGWLIPFVVGIIGLGGVVLSRFGSIVYLPSAVAVAPSSPQYTVDAEPVPTPPQPPKPSRKPASGSGRSRTRKSGSQES